MSREEAMAWLERMARENIGAVRAEGKWWFKADLRDIKYGRALAPVGR